MNMRGKLNNSKKIWLVSRLISFTCLHDHFPFGTEYILTVPCCPSRRFAQSPNYREQDAKAVAVSPVTFTNPVGDLE